MNLFLPKDYGNLSPGLTNLEYAPYRNYGRVTYFSEILIVQSRYWKYGSFSQTVPKNKKING